MRGEKFGFYMTLFALQRLQIISQAFRVISRLGFAGGNDFLPRLSLGGPGGHLRKAFLLSAGI